MQGANVSDDEAAQLVERVKATEQNLSKKFVIPEASADSPISLIVPAYAVPPDNGEEKELASIILWTLAREDVSSLKIKETFKMGKRADTIIDKLCEFGLLSEKFANQPRRVLPQSVEDVPQTVMDLLTRRGVSVDDVAAALNKRNPDNEIEYGHDANC